MAGPTARVLALLERLQSGGTHAVGDLARELGVDERTVRRYAAHLLDLGVPVESLRGRYGGYRVAPGYRMPPLMLTDDEAVAVVLALRSSTDGQGAGSTVLAKVRRVLPARLRARLTALEETTDLLGHPPADVATALLLELAEAAHDRRPVQIDHESRDGRRTRRTLHPHGIVAHRGHWYVTGADSASHETRTFRLDRITAATVRAGSFTTAADVDPTDQVLASLERTPWRHEVTIRIGTTAEHARTSFPRGLATVTAAEDGVVVELRAEHLDWLPPLLAALDRPFVIDRPEELRAGVRALAARLKESADRTEQGG